MYIVITVDIFDDTEIKYYDSLKEALAYVNSAYARKIHLFDATEMKLKRGKVTREYEEWVVQP